MNSVIEAAFADYNVPVCYLYYEGHGEPYVTYTLTDNESTFSADDEIQNYVSFYDFDIYSKGNYRQIESDVKERLKAAGFEWMPSRDSSEMYEPDTKYFHKTLCFSIERSVNNG